MGTYLLGPEFSVSVRAFHLLSLTTLLDLQLQIKAEPEW